jgi:hypothetical protein
LGNYTTTEDLETIYATKDYVDNNSGGNGGSGGGSGDTSSYITKEKFFDGSLTKDGVTSETFPATNNTINIGGNAETSYSNKNISIGLGTSMPSLGVSNIILGNLSTIVNPESETEVATNNAIVIGAEATSSLENSVAIGSAAIVEGSELSDAQSLFSSVAVGYHSHAESNNAVAIGSHTSAELNSVAVGVGANAGENSVAIGTLVTAPDDSVYVGNLQSKIKLGKLEASLYSTETDVRTKSELVLDGIRKSANILEAVGSVSIGQTSIDVSSTEITFNQQPKVLSTVTPTEDNDIITKKYVDDRIVKNPNSTTNIIQLGGSGTTKLLIGTYFIEFHADKVDLGVTDGSYVSITYRLNE